MYHIYATHQPMFIVRVELFMYYIIDKMVLATILLYALRLLFLRTFDFAYEKYLCS